MTENRDTKERILDAAERLFAEEGFHCTSTRRITRGAGVNLAAVNYHFGSKEALIAAVFERRLEPLNRERRLSLEAVRDRALQETRPAEAQEVLRAFVDPTLRFAETSPGARAFVTLVGRALAEPDATVRNIFVGRMMPIFLLMLDLLGQALPALPKQVLFWRLHFTLGAISHVLHMHDRFHDLPQLPEGVDPGLPMEELSRLLLPYLTAGMEAES